MKVKRSLYFWFGPNFHLQKLRNKEENKNEALEVEKKGSSENESEFLIKIVLDEIQDFLFLFSL